MNIAPKTSELNKIFEILNKSAVKPNYYVLLHCFTGRNRTGYIICYFLCRRLNITCDEALNRFYKARGYKLKKEILVKDLREKFG